MLFLRFSFHGVYRYDATLVSYSGAVPRDQKLRLYDVLGS